MRTPEEYGLIAEAARLLGTPGFVRPTPLGLRPVAHHTPVHEINSILVEAEERVRSHFELPRHWRTFDAIQTPHGIAVVHSPNDGTRFGDLAESLEDDDRFIVTIGGQAFDTRKGMTLGVYRAVRNRRAHGHVYGQGDKFDHNVVVNKGRGTHDEKDWVSYALPGATMLTGEDSTPNGGVPVIFRDGTVEVHDPKALKWEVPSHERGDRTLVVFRPGVVLGYDMFPDELPRM